MKMVAANDHACYSCDVTSQKYPLLRWRPWFDILACYIPCVVAVWLVYRISFWFYPIAFVVIANRLLALSLICHEGMHGNLLRNQIANDFVGRYLCAFPCFISFSKYRRVHFIHHGAAGSQRWDPDHHLYAIYPISGWKFLRHHLWRWITLQTALDFISYYCEIDEALFCKRTSQHRLWILSRESDFIGFMSFWMTTSLILYKFNLMGGFLCFYIAPMLALHPYVFLIGGLQHGPEQNHTQPELVSRSVRGSKPLMELLLPCDINFHAEHHRHPAIPHYWLRQFAQDLENRSIFVWKQSYIEAIRSLFKVTN
jgi:fatty acid desaturase